MNTLRPGSHFMDQDLYTVETYMNNAVRIIDEKFGEGYARENPGLIGDFMKTAALDFSTNIRTRKRKEMTQAINDLACSVSDISSAIVDQMSKSSGDQLEGLTRVSKSIDGLASVVEDTAENYPSKQSGGI